MMSENKITLKDDKKISLLFWTILSYNVVTLFLNTVVNFFMPGTPIDTLVCMLAFGVVLAYAVLVILKRQRAMNYILYMYIAFLCISAI